MTTKNTNKEKDINEIQREVATQLIEVLNKSPLSRMGKLDTLHLTIVMMAGVQSANAYAGLLKKLEDGDVSVNSLLEAVQ